MAGAPSRLYLKKELVLAQELCEFWPNDLPNGSCRMNFVFVDALPHTSTGKLMKTECGGVIRIEVESVNQTAKTIWPSTRVNASFVRE